MCFLHYSAYNFGVNGSSLSVLCRIWNRRCKLTNLGPVSHKHLKSDDLSPQTYNGTKVINVLKMLLPAKLVIGKLRGNM